MTKDHRKEFSPQNSCCLQTEYIKSNFMDKLKKPYEQ